MKLGDTVRTMTGKIGTVVAFPCYSQLTETPGPRVQLEIRVAINGCDSTTIRAAYDPRDLTKVGEYHD